ncbi:NADH-quinone oxidoreductase subunit G [Mangrovactinospora gilvigrisea]|uniref:NADH-quinone oxidoreductase n=1 Tax=Mangrovactinospora gilvigrisea TaxID=1428644 RepID=A0A1J7CC09_9ACTN|nr:NADH-quinone oxidoreductase subunit G [Mangrovactinospora gilvigrisea]OIV39044.1 NADH-quinone oxidoreductase subunit G [Mangrovactinospora gilvigrisea]
MTVTSEDKNAPAAPPPQEMVTVTVDGAEVSVPKGTLVIRAAELLGIQIPRFCDHPLLDPAGACRQCIVEVEGQRKPMASCTTACTDGMVVKTQLTSEVAEKAQHGVMELLLINHPLDCPVCDKGGECPLQNQAMSNGRGSSRFEGVKRTFPKPVKVSEQVLLDRERCVSCARCTRFSEQIAGDPFIDLIERGSNQQVGTGDDQPFASYFSGNTVQICPVGALTAAAYRFRSRPFDLVSSPGMCEHCASGCAIRTDHRRGKVLRRLAGDEPEVNEEWNCDKGRWAFRYAQLPDRLTTPQVRDAESGELRTATWPEALDAAARGLAAVRGRAAALPGGRVTVEDAYAWAKFARVALGTNDVDFRARVHSPEEERFLGGLAGRGLDLDGSGVSYRALEHAPAVLLVDLEPEEESPIVFLRLRKAVKKRRQQVYSLAPFASRGLAKLDGTLLPAAPGTVPEWLDALAGNIAPSEEGTAAGAALRQEGAVVLVGERAAGTAGTLSRLARLAEATGATVAWVPRRAGERGAVEAGALPGLLPGGRQAADPEARAEVARRWGAAELPSRPGRDTAAIVGAVLAGEVRALLVGGVQPDDLPDPRAALEALERAEFVVSLEQRPGPVTDRADVVLPVAAAPEKSGTYLDWEGRARAFTAALLPDQLTSRKLPADLRVLHMLADAMDVHLGLPDEDAARAELTDLGARPSPDHHPSSSGSARSYDPPEPAAALPRPAEGQAVLAGWRLLLDNGRLQDGDPHLAGTRHPAVARVSPVTAAEAGVGQGGELEVSGPAGSVRLPVEITEMPDRVVWLPLNSTGRGVAAETGAVPGDVLRIAAAAPAETAPQRTAPQQDVSEEASEQ